MGWSCGFDKKWQRDIGYGVPAVCDFPDCGEEIDRGLYYVCGGEPYGGDDGCGLYFCGHHLDYEFDDEFDVSVGPQRCDNCIEGKPPHEPTPDTDDWIHWKLTDPSWAEWREKNPDWVKAVTTS